MRKILSIVVIFSSSMLMATIHVNAQQHANVKGTWKMSVETTAGSGTPVFELKHDTETTISGTYKGQLGEAAVKGTVQGKNIRLEFSISDNLIEYNGTVDGDTMKGKVKLGSMAEGTFSGTRNKS